MEDDKNTVASPPPPKSLQLTDGNQVRRLMGAVLESIPHNVRERRAVESCVSSLRYAAPGHESYHYNRMVDALLATRRSSRTNKWWQRVERLLKGEIPF